MLTRFLLLGFVLLNCSAQAKTDSTYVSYLDADFPWIPKVIYGDDNRLDLFQVNNAQQIAAADSTVAVIKAVHLQDNNDGTSAIETKSFGETYRLCENEPFREQKVASYCSGFLVSEDTIVTAGHCIEDETDCRQARFVFGFALKTPDATYTTAKTEDVYECSQIIHREVDGRGADFAVIKLNRPVSNHRPLELRREGSVVAGQSLTVIGNPSGLPTKVAPGAVVRRLENKFFVANLDTYGGNSGSAVFNDSTGMVEGILVRGERDFVPQNGCMISNRCAAEECRGEDVTAIANVLPFLN